MESNAACAAYAFAASFNRIVALSAATKVSREVYEVHFRTAQTQCSTLSAFTRIWRASYRAGLVRGLKEARGRGGEGLGGGGEGVAGMGTVGGGGGAGGDDEWQARYEEMLRDEPVPKYDASEEHLEEHPEEHNMDTTPLRADDPLGDIHVTRGGQGKGGGGGGHAEWRERKLQAMIIHTKKIGERCGWVGGGKGRGSCGIKTHM